MKKRIVVANWKMYIQTPDEALNFITALRPKLRSLPSIEVSIAPSFVLLPLMREKLARTSIKVGAQAVSPHANGAHTGDVSSAMLKAAGASFTIVGHSERRALGETNDDIRAEILEATGAGLGVVLCVGERERGEEGDHFAFIKQQLSSALINLPKKALSKISIAYEPVWAIGKSAADAMHPQDVQEAVIFIKKTLTAIVGAQAAKRVPILYGGSVEVENALPLIEGGGVQGFLVGHTSANLENFIALLKACK